MMHLQSCEHPIRVFNKATGEYVFASCGKCNTCRKRKASVWIARLEEERRYHLFAAFVTLTYNDESLPKFVPVRVDSNEFNNCVLDLVDSDFRLVSCRNKIARCILRDQLDLSNALDKEYFSKRIAAFGGIPFADFSDIQRYHKRLNKLIHDKVTGKYSNFRFFTVSEYGSTTHRPHFHELLFFDDSKVASVIGQLVRDAWCDKRISQSSSCLGRTDCQIIEKSACSYVAAYVNQLFDLPSFYSHRELRPRFVCSKRPSLGTGGYNSEVLREIFDSESITHVVPERETNGFKVVPLLPCIKNRLFPRIAFFESLSHSLRVKLYGLAFTNGIYWDSFETFCRFIPSLLRTDGEVGLQAYNYITKNDKCFGKVPHSFLRRLYYISKRVVTFCLTCNYQLNAYVSKIERYYDKCKIALLGEFYRFQEDYSKHHSFESLIHMYPEYRYQNSDCDFIPLESCEDYYNMVYDSAKSYAKMVKTHMKNSYLEAKSETSDFFNFLKFIWYAQKCNENFKAIPEFVPK